MHQLARPRCGRSKEWNNGVPSDFATMKLDDNDEVAGEVDDIPTALRRLASPAASRDNGIAAAPPSKHPDHNTMTTFPLTMQEEVEAMCWAPGAPVASIAIIMEEFDNDNANNSTNDNANNNAIIFFRYTTLRSFNRD